jgi:hypothetical protein
LHRLQRSKSMQHYSSSASEPTTKLLPPDAPKTAGQTINSNLSSNLSYNTVGATIGRPPNICIANIGISKGNHILLPCGNGILFAKCPGGQWPPLRFLSIDSSTNWDLNHSAFSILHFAFFVLYCRQR